MALNDLVPNSLSPLICFYDFSLCCGSSELPHSLNALHVLLILTHLTHSALCLQGPFQLPFSVKQPPPRVSSPNSEVPLTESICT